MKRLDLKGIDVGGDYLADHQPANLEFFSLWITATIGLVNEEGGTQYQLHVCTPDWVKYALKYGAEKQAIWGRHMLIVDEFDTKKIEKLINDKLRNISDTFSENKAVNLSEVVARYAHWEFEDFVQYEGETKS